jgi:hypothetical protein
MNTNIEVRLHANARPLNEFNYDLALIDADFRKLVLTYRTFEERVVADLVLRFTDYLQRVLGATPKGQVAVIDGRSYKLIVENSPVERVLNLSLLPLFDTKARVIWSEAKIDHFGRVKAIRVEWPGTVRRSPEPILESLRQHALNAYIALEVVFIEKYGEFEKILLRNLYEILNIRIKQAGKESLVGRSWFSVTNTKTLKFYYHFSRERLIFMIDHFKRKQVFEFSPFELLTCLVTDEVSDSLFASGIDTHSGFATFPFDQLLTVQENIRFWTAEFNLFQDSDLSAREICAADNYSLQLNCPTRIAPDLDVVLTPALSDLAQQFRKNLKEYSAFRKTVSRLNKPIHESGIYEEIKDFLASFFAKIFVEYTK